MKKIYSLLYLLWLVSATGNNVYSQSLNFTYGISPGSLIINHFAANNIVISNVTGNLQPNSGAAFGKLH